MILALIFCLKSTSATLENTLDKEIGDAAREAKGAADVGFTELKRLATARTAPHLGFINVDEASRSVLDREHPEVVFVLSTKRLARFTAGSLEKGPLTKSGDIDKLLALLDLPGEVVFLVKVDGKSRATVITVRAEKGWVLAGLGRAAINVEDTERTGFVIKIPSFDLSLVAHAANDDLALTSLVNAPRYGLSVNSQIRATTLFETLSRIVNAR